jgi:rhodanese-related sulfurtransferase
MKSICFLLFFSSVAATAQYRHDGVSFKTVNWDDLCTYLQNNPEYTILDVRSKGEYDDTAAQLNLNIGHIKNAVNIDIRELPARISEISHLKEKPLFLYCSHSQRSRRAAKLLSDSGFTKVFNINGGLSNLYLSDNPAACAPVVTEAKFNFLSPYKWINSKKQFFVLDVRPDSAYQGISSNERRNAMGKIRNAVHIPLARLEEEISKIPGNRQVLIIDDFGQESMRAARLLHEKGYKNLQVLFNGLDGLHAEFPEAQRHLWENSVTYHTIPAESFNELAVQTKDLLIIDVRSHDEFTNLSKEAWRNMGNIRGAMNIPASEWDAKTASLPSDTRTTVLLYGATSSPEVFEVAKKLTHAGYPNVYVLAGGLFNLRWKAANLKGRAHLSDWAVNIPPDNL